jgi:HEAT repeat protein/thiol-disulfide isomerase/thioredoxin
MSATGRTGALVVWVVAAASLLGADGPATPVDRVMPHAGWESASEAALADGQPVLMIFHAPWCGACHKLQEETLGTDSFQTMAAPLHLVAIDAEAEPRLAGEYRVQSLPDMLLLSGEGQVVARRQGFLNLDAMLAWLAEGRQRIAQGRWEGFSAADQDADLVRRARDGALTDAEIGEATRRLSAPDPALRATGLAFFLALEAKAVPTLLQAAADPYLGVRLSAVEVLERFAPEAPAVDPWADTAERTAQLKALTDWWNRDGRPAALFEAGAKRAAPPPVDARKLGTLLEGVMSDRPMQRTESLNALLRIGAEALPAIHEVLKRSERLGRSRACRSLEDLRWAILIPGEVERAAPGARRSLARGTVAERLAAVERLARAGREALPALGELLRDGDPLVRERALHSLSAVGGPEAIAAMSQLLKSPDANLRMTAAQDLGRTKDRSASESLSKAMADPDEVVACTAIAAIEELEAKDRQDAILAALKDPRWRVRARAAEAAGKLKLGGTSEALRGLLKDADPFVLKNALEALRSLNATPPEADLLALLERAPELTSLVIEFLLREEAKRFPSIMALYKKADTTGRVRLLDSLAPHRGSYSSRPGQDAHWKDLIALAAADPDLEIRRRAARLLLQRSPEVAMPFVEGFLRANDPKIFETMCPRVLTIAAYHWGIGQAPEKRGVFGALYVPPASGEEKGQQGHLLGALVASIKKAFQPKEAGHEDVKKTAGAKQADPGQIRRNHAVWHELLQAQAGDSPSLAASLAVYLTGDPEKGAEALNRAFDRPPEALEHEFKNLGDEGVIGLLLRRVSWPGARQAIERAAAQPALYAEMLKQLSYASKEFHAFLSDPERQVAMGRKASRDALETLIGLWISTKQRYGSGRSLVSLCAQTPSNDAMIERLAASGEASLRTVAVFLCGHYRTDMASLAMVERALGDPDRWVRVAAVQCVSRLVKDRKRLDALLGPLLADPSDETAKAAAQALLTDELRAAAEMDSDFKRFRFDTIDIYREYTSSSESSERPLTRIEAQPEFLAQARQRLAALQKRLPKPINLEDAGDDTRGLVLLQSALALLLAQYGDLVGLDLLAQRPVDKDLPDDMVAGIRLSQDPRYLPLLAQAARKAENRRDVQKLLKAVADMTGNEVRKFRRESNRRLREMPE